MVLIRAVEFHKGPGDTGLTAFNFSSLLGSSQEEASSPASPTPGDTGEPPSPAILAATLALRGYLYSNSLLGMKSCLQCSSAAQPHCAIFFSTSFKVFSVCLAGY